MKIENICCGKMMEMILNESNELGLTNGHNVKFSVHSLQKCESLLEIKFAGRYAKFCPFCGKQICIIISID